MKNLLYHLKAVKSGTQKLQSEPEQKFLNVGAGAGAEKNSFGSTTLKKEAVICQRKTSITIKQ
jgi:hypothetical protein